MQMQAHSGLEDMAGQSGGTVSFPIFSRLASRREIVLWRGTRVQFHAVIDQEYHITGLFLVSFYTAKFNFYITARVIIFTTFENLAAMFKKIFHSFLLICFTGVAMAQDTLPKVSVKLLGRKALVSWINPHQNITSINIQRSGDSLRYYTSIGTVLNVGAKSNGFVDQKEFLPNEQYYRLFITFEGGDYMFTAAHRPVADTATINPAVAEMLERTEPEEKTDSRPAPNYFIPSGYVYTGKDQNVVISLPDAKHKKYSIKFFEDDGTFLFELKKIPESFLIVDKANFYHSGLFRFELYENGAIKEMHKLYIPRPGRPMPSLDVNGYEIRR